MAASFESLFYGDVRPERTIPNRWLSPSRSGRPQLDFTQAVGRSPSASGSRDMRQKADTPADRRLRWGRSTDADGDEDVRADFRRILLHRKTGLTEPSP